MAWIKRNLIFVIAVAVGLALTGYCGYRLYKVVSDNAAMNEDYASTSSNLKDIQQKTPTPNKENIQAAKDDQKRIQQFLADFHKSFSAFPAAPVKDEKGFKTYLEDTLVRFRAGASNAGVQVPPDYTFSFSGLVGKLTYPPGNIAPWMQEMQEIDSILAILYAAKVNALDSLQRVPVALDDSSTEDCLPSAPVTNQWGVLTPYKITFHGFSTEVAAVMEGFARSSNCFIVKTMSVVNERGGTAATAATAGQSQTPSQVQPATTQRYMAPPPMAAPQPSRGRGGREGGGEPFGMRRPSPVRVAPVVTQVQAAPAAPTVALPVTILAETPLQVTLSIEIVKLNTSEH
jgi:hypothetical protein